MKIDEIRFVSERPGPSSENDIGLVIKKVRDKTLYVLFLNGRVSAMYEDDTIPVEVSKKTITSFSDMLLELGARVGLLQDGYCHNKTKIHKLIDEYLENNGINRQSEEIEEKILEFLTDLQTRKPELFQNAEETFTDNNTKGLQKQKIRHRNPNSAFRGLQEAIEEQRNRIAEGRWIPRPVQRDQNGNVVREEF